MILPLYFCFKKGLSFLKFARLLLLACLMLAVVFVAGCGEQEEVKDPAEAPPEEAEERKTGEELEEQEETVADLELLSSAKFAAYREYPVDVEPAVAPYEVEAGLKNVANREMFHLSPAAEEMLVKNGFVVVPSHYKEYYSLYEHNRYMQQPSFVTTDSMLHNYHLFFNRLLRVTEEEQLVPILEQLTQSMLAVSREQYEQLQGTAWENAALRNTGFFAVAGELLGLETDDYLPPAVAEQVEKELELIAAREGIAISPIMNLGAETATPRDALEEDYTQYITRGHYTENETLQSYFKTMMWYGRMTFRAKSEDETMSAALITMALNEGDNLQKWEDIYAPTTFFVGQSDDLTYLEYGELLQEIYGETLSLKTLVEEGGKFEAFMEAAARLEPPNIQSIPIYDEELNPDREQEVKGFRFMGQRFTLDAFIFQKLVYRDVTENEEGQRRMLPKGLDIPAAMGSAEAYEILDAAGETDYGNYPENMEKLRRFIGDLDQEAWTQNLYWGWLYTLKALAGERGEGYPSFMQNRAWERKELNTFLGSWTELKHDTILYSKQVYAEMGGGPEQDDRGYVEPVPHLYARLASLAQMTREGLERREMISGRDSDNLKRLEQLALYLKEISEKQLSGKPLTEEEHELIRSYGGQLEHLWLEAMRDENEMEMAPSSMEDSPAALVADVATDPDGARVLQEATGNIFEIYVVVPLEDSLRIAKGGVYSHYEFPRPMDQRLTNEEWQEMLRAGDVPPLCEWKKEFIADDGEE